MRTIERTIRSRKLCELVELDRQVFYRWASPTLSAHYIDDAYLVNEIVDIYRKSRKTYGSPRVWGQLGRNSTRVSRKRVERIMAEVGLVGAHSRKKWRKGKRHDAPAEDLLERDFTAGSSDLRWVSDITEFKRVDGKLFLAGVLDLHDQSLAGWSIGVRQTADLTVNALVMALRSTEP